MMILARVHPKQLMKNFVKLEVSLKSIILSLGFILFIKKKKNIYENLLPPLRVLDAKREKELISNLEKLNFSIKSLMAA